MTTELIEEINRGGVVYSIKWKGMSNIPAHAELEGGLFVDNLIYNGPSDGTVIGPNDLEIGTYMIFSVRQLVVWWIDTSSSPLIWLMLRG